MRVRSYTYNSGLNAFYYNTKVCANKRGFICGSLFETLKQDFY